MRTGSAYGIRAAIATIAAAIAAGFAFAQTPDAPSSPPPTARELATRFVMSSDTSGPELLEMAREAVQEELETEGAKLPVNVKTWMATAFSAASVQVTNELLPTLEQRLIDAYATRFTAEELQQVLDFQVWIRRPEIADVMAASGKAATPVAGMEILRNGLSKEDFDRILRFTLTHPMKTVTAITMQQAQEITEEFSDRLNEAIVKYCGNAPKGVTQCEKQGRPL